MLMSFALHVKKEMMGGDGLALSVKRGEFWNDQPVGYAFSIHGSHS